MVTTPDYNVYIKKMFNGQTGRICTNIEVNRKNITLIKQDTSRTLTSKNKLTWDNIKVGTILYDKDDSCQAQILDFNEKINEISLKYECDTVIPSNMNAKIAHPQSISLEHINSYWYVKKL